VLHLRTILPGTLRTGLKEKFKFKSISEPSVDFIFNQIDFAQLKANWEDQLGHQLQVLPPVESFYTELKPALSWWIDEHPSEPTLAMISTAKDETILPRVHFPESTILQAKRIGIGRQTDTFLNSRLDQIRYAARNRLCVEINYHRITRLVEPYSLRRPNTGNLLLYVYELERGGFRSGSIKAYKLFEITNAEVTHQVFSPRYIVEL